MVHHVTGTDCICYSQGASSQADQLACHEFSCPYTYLELHEVTSESQRRRSHLCHAHVTAGSFESDRVAGDGCDVPEEAVLCQAGCLVA